MNDGLVEVFEYNRWANLALIEGCRAAPAELLTRQVEGISGTVASLWTHLVGGERTFILRTKGRQHEGELHRFSAWPGFDELERLAKATGDELVGIARELDAAAVSELSWQGKTYRYPTRFFLLHAATHSMEHRTEIKVALNTLGFETPDLDGWNFAAAKGYGEDVTPGG